MSSVHMRSIERSEPGIDKCQLFSIERKSGRDFFKQLSTTYGCEISPASNLLSGMLGVVLQQLESNVHSSELYKTPAPAWHQSAKSDMWHHN